MPALHVVSGSHLNRITPSVESYSDADHYLLNDMPKADPRNSYSRPHRSEPYPMSHAGSSPRRESITSTAGPGHERPSTAWTPEDDTKLMDLRKQGLNWGPVAEHFQGKTANACRKRHERLMERKHTTEYDGVRIEELSSAYFECREKMWSILADFLREPKWQTLETKCFGQGLKNLQTAARQQQRAQGGAGARAISPGGSHNSEGGFDDSGLGHSPPEASGMLPMPLGLSSQSPSSMRASRENSSPYHGRASLDPPRPHILSAPVATYNYPNPTTHSGYGGVYGLSGSGYPAPQPVNLPPPSTSMSHPTLPSLTRTFNVHELPPVNSGYHSRHISATYG